MSSLPLPLPTRVLLQYLEGDLTRSETDQIEHLLAECSVSRRRLAKLLEMQSQLRAGDPTLDQVDIVPAVRAAIQSQGTQQIVASRSVRRLIPLGIGLAATAAVALTFRFRPPSGTDSPTGRTHDEEFRAKSAAPESTKPRWVDLDVARVPATEAPQALGETLPASDGLLVSYTNLGLQPFRYLMVFAVDVAGDVFWLYPEYDRVDSDPISVEIAAGRAPLPEVIHHNLHPGRLTIHGVFTRSPLKVSEIEGAVNTLVRSGRWKSPLFLTLPVPDSSSTQVVVSTVVVQ
jgi:hypothetical protein